MYDIVVWFDGVNALSVLAIVGFLTFVYWIVQLSGRSIRTFRVWVTNELNTKNLSRELREVTELYQLGINLGIPSYELKSIELQYPSTDRQRIEIVDLWLQRTPNPSWRDVAIALEEMGANALAEKIHHKHTKRASKFDTC